LAVLGVFLSVCARGAIFHYVDASGTNPVSPYLSWETAATNIEDAAVLSSAGHVVLVTNGVYQYGAYPANGSNRVYVLGNGTVQSVNGPSVTTIVGYQNPSTTNGNNAIRCVYLGTGALLSGFTLTNGATQTGGFPYGGGVYCAGTSSIISNCVITGNSAYSLGGGVFSGTLVSCMLSGNVCAPFSSAGSGGGADNSVLTNCLLTANRCAYRGAAAEACTLINCTVVTNIGQADGLDGCKLRNCIAYYNYPDNGEGSGDGTSFSNCCTATLPTFNSANNITNAPQFVNWTNGDFHLLPTSPCVNAGVNAYISQSTDLDGNPRIVGGRVDLGAYEYQAKRYVDINNTNPVSPFTSWSTAATNIQDGVDASIAGDLILVNDGMYQTGGRAVYSTATNRVVVNKAVTVQSVNGPAATTILGFNGPSVSGGHYIRCAYLTNGASLNGFTLMNGGMNTSSDATNGSGGGVWCAGPSATVSNCVLMANNAEEFGGGAYGGTLNDCVISNNLAFISGGGAYNSVLNNCLIVTNKLIQGNGGGGVSSCIASNCVIVQNFAPGYGGGAYSSTLNNCVISNNSAFFGGGVSFGVINNSLIFSNSARINGHGGGAYSNTLNNCILENNLASTGGGATMSTLVNCTVVSNTASSVGGGVDSGVLVNCILYQNYATNSPDFPNDSRSVLNYCDVTSELATNGAGNITNDPAFVNLAVGDFHLQSNSPCINSGRNGYVTTSIDFDGNLRISGGTVDIGAYEFQNPASIISYSWLQQYGLPTDGSADLLDLDGTGMNNLQKSIAGLDPTNPASVLAMSSLVPPQSSSGVTVTWQSVNERAYYLQRATNLAARLAFSTIQSNIIGQVGTTSYTDTTATNGNPYFYRVGVQ
jgi:hypothetical protein